MTGSPIERSYWLDTVSQRADFAAAMPSSVDCAIVGAGFTGLAAARVLAMRGSSVAVLEQHDVAWGASSRNGGMVLTGLKVDATTLLAKYGAQHARALFSTSLAAIDCVERIVRDEAIDCAFTRCGHAEVASKPGHFDAMRRTAETLADRFDHRVHVVYPKYMAGVVASPAYHGALIDDASASVNPAMLAHGMAEAARRRGADILERTRVSAIARADHDGSRGFTIETERGALRAAAVLIATGAYAFTPWIKRRVVPVGSYVIVTEALDAAVASDLIPGARMIFDSNHFLHYYRLTPDRRMLFGGRAAFFPADERTTRESAAILRRDMIAAFPQLHDAQIAYAWGGTIDFTFDQLPHAGMQGGLYYAVGYAGHGVAMATLVGERIASAMLGDIAVSDVLATGSLPSPPPGLAGDAPWFLPLAGAWYRLLDWAS